MPRQPSLMIALVLLLAPIAGRTAPPAAKVLSVKGKLTVNGRPAAVGAVLHTGDQVATGPGSQAFLGFADGSALRLNAGSKLNFSDLGRKTSLALNAGSALSVVHKGTPYSISTSRAVAAVRGTIFYIEATKQRPGYVCVCEGRVRVTSRMKGHHSQLISTKHHQAVSIGRKEISPARMLGHTDADIAELKGYAH